MHRFGQLVEAGSPGAPFKTKPNRGCLNCEHVQARGWLPRRVAALYMCRKMNTSRPTRPGAASCHAVGRVFEAILVH